MEAHFNSPSVLMLGRMKAIATACAAFLLMGVNSGRAADEMNLMPPKELAALLGKPGADKLSLIHVGFPVLYRGKHIPHSVFAGPGAKPEGLENLATAVGSASKDRSIVIYCGCCPMDKCPNIRPAFQKLKALGYQNVKVVIIPTNLHEDWTSKGYPVEKGDIQH